MKSPELAHLSITSPALITTNLFAAACLALSSHSVQTLTSITLDFTSPSAGIIPNGQSDSYRITIEEIRPLLALHNMEYFGITSPFIEPDDRLLGYMGLAWPLLKSLILNPRYLPVGHLMREVPRVTMEGLYVLIKRCLGLHGVTCPVNASSASTLDAPPLPPSDRRSMLIFDFVSSTIHQEDFVWVAVTLNAICRSPVQINNTDPWVSADFSLSAQAAGISPEVYRAERDRRELLWREVGRQVASFTS
jgi:hypothetical protein